MREAWMRLALQEARAAQLAGEVPVGAVVECGGQVIAAAHNERETRGDPTAHAEILALQRAARALGRRRLDGCTMYVTLEPCPMCAGAILNARIEKVVFGAKDKTSQDGLFEKILTSNRLNHKTEFVQDASFEEKCSKILTQFFKSKRKP